MFKDNRTWDAARKEKFIRDVITMRTEFDTRDIFESLVADYGTSPSNLQNTYYRTISGEAAAVQALMKQLDSEGVAYIDPYSGYNPRCGKGIESHRVIPKSPEITPPSHSEQPKAPAEEDILTVTGGLLEGLMQLQGSDTVSFLKGLTAMVNKAVGADFSDEREKLKAEITALKERLEDANHEYSVLEKQYAQMKEDLASASYMIEEYQKLNAALKVARSGEFVSRLKIVVDKYGNVLKAVPEVG